MKNPAPGENRARVTAASLLAVAVGGFLGAALRIAFELALPDASGFPATTLLINVAGSAALGAYTAAWKIKTGTPAWLRAGIGTGFFGAFTTYSTVIIFAFGAPLGTAIFYVGVSLALSGLSAWYGMHLTERRMARAAHR